MMEAFSTASAADDMCTLGGGRGDLGLIVLKMLKNRDNILRLCRTGIKSIYKFEYGLSEDSGVEDSRVFQRGERSLMPLD